MIVSAPFLEHFSILYVEDNPLDVELAESCLRAGGLQFQMEIAATRSEFEAAVEHSHYDLILADYSLPDFDGLTALGVIRKIDERIPFIFLSGVLGEEVAVETLHRGATDYVLKRNMDRLVPAVKRAMFEYKEFLSRERAEQELRAVDARFQTLTNSLPSMVWTCDREGKLTYSNTLWKQWTGGVERWFEERVFHPADLGVVLTAWANAQIHVRAFELDCRIRRHKDDTYHWHLLRATPLTSEDGSLKEWVAICTDTEQQRLRETQLRTTEKLALTGRLASVIAHEINNPLEAITNTLYIMGTVDPASADFKALLAMAEHELVRISAITRQTLQWSRDEATTTVVSAGALVAETLKLFAAKLNNKNIKVQQEIEADVELNIIAGELRQVLANLISNSIDAVGVNGAISIHVRATADSSGMQWADIAISDNGPGIAPHIQARLFQPFQSTKGALGTGLGLYVSKELVARYGGDLTAHSRPGKGTRMHIRLPLLEPGVPPETDNSMNPLAA